MTDSHDQVEDVMVWRYKISDLQSLGNFQSRTRDSTPCRVGRSVRPSVTFLNSEWFSHYCSCPTVCDWTAVLPALLFSRWMFDVFVTSSFLSKTFENGLDIFPFFGHSTVSLSLVFGLTWSWMNLTISAVIRIKLLKSDSPLAIYTVFSQSQIFPAENINYHSTLCLLSISQMAVRPPMNMRHLWGMIWIWSLMVSGREQSNKS